MLNLQERGQLLVMYLEMYLYAVQPRSQTKRVTGGTCSGSLYHDHSLDQSVSFATFCFKSGLEDWCSHFTTMTSSLLVSNSFRVCFFYDS